MSYEYIDRSRIVYEELEDEEMAIEVLKVQTKYIPALSDGRAIESVLKQPVTLPIGVCQ